MSVSVIPVYSFRLSQYRFVRKRNIFTRSSENTPFKPGFRQTQVKPKTGFTVFKIVYILILIVSLFSNA